MLKTDKKDAKAVNRSKEEKGTFAAVKPRETIEKEKTASLTNTNLADALIATTPTNDKPTTVILKTDDSSVNIAVAKPQDVALLPIPNTIPSPKTEKPLKLQTDNAVPEPIQKKTPQKKATTETSGNTLVAKKSSEGSITTASLKELKPIGKEDEQNAKDKASVLIPIKDIVVVPTPKEKIALEAIIQTDKIKPAAGQEISDLSVTDKSEANSTPVSLTTPEPIEDKAMSPKTKKLTRAEKNAQEAALKQIERKEKAHKSLEKIQIWEAKEGSSLKRILTKWSEQTNAELSWNIKENHDLTMDLYVSGTFENALKTLFSMGIHDGPKYTLDKENATLLISE